MLVLLIAFSVQAAAACRLAAVRGAPDTASRAARWIESHLDPVRDRLAVVPSLELPLLRDDESLEHAPRTLEGSLDPWIVYQAGLFRRPRAPTWSVVILPFQSRESGRNIARDPIKALRDARAGYLAVELFHRPIYDEFLARVRAACTRVARFSPDDSNDVSDEGTTADAAPERRAGDQPLIALDEVGSRDAYEHSLRAALQVHRLGTVIEIYRLPDAAIPK